MGIPSYIFIIKDRQEDGGGKDEDSCLQTRNTCFKNEERNGEDEKSSYRIISRRGRHELEKGTDSQRDLFHRISQQMECNELIKEDDEVLHAILETRGGRWGFEGSDSRRSFLPLVCPRHDERFGEGEYKCVCQSPKQPTRKLFL